MELFGYANLAETFVYDNNNIEDWMYILEKLFKVHKLLESHEVTSNKDDLEAIYVEKTIKRLNDLEKVQDFDKILAKDFIKINGEEFKNLPLIKDEVMKKCYELAEYQGNFGVTHGDYCFSNILFDPMFYIFRLVDPRGRFKDKSIYGDPRYDIAKLRHSVVGLYDFIVLGFYNIKQISANNFEFKILASKEKAVLVDYFDSLTERFGFNTSEIKLIEGLLFLTMIPLHGDSLNRQKAFYLTAIKKLNEALNER